MASQIMDCCSFLNLYTGWGSLEPLKTLDFFLHISEAVLDESVYTNEFSPKGDKVRLELDLRSMQAELGYEIVRPETSEEVNDYIDFAMEIDDGEAQSLAIAKHRNLVLLSDDRKALALARKEDVGVQTCTTVEVLRLWSSAAERNAEQLSHVLRRISELARYRPRVGSPDRAWWDAHLE